MTETKAERHLLLIAIGPIQDFIASARRCQDLWFGSHLLSELARAVAESLRDEVGEEALVFPGLLDTDGKTSVANKIVAVVPAARAKAIAEEARQAMDRTLRRHRMVAFAGVDGVGFFKERAIAHVDTLMEFYWVSVPLADAQDATYKQARTDGEALLAARKNTRTWPQTRREDDAGHPKSSLDGARETVIDPRLHKRDKQRPDLRPLSAGQLRRRFGVKREEHLCGVGLLKRRGTDLMQGIVTREAVEGAEGDDLAGILTEKGAPTFHSTSHMASAPYRVRLAMAGPAASSALQQYYGTIGGQLGYTRIKAGTRTSYLALPPWGVAEGDTRYIVPRVLPFNGDPTPPRGQDGYLLYPSRLDDVLEEYNEQGGSAKRHNRDAHDALRALLKTAGGEPTAYYVLLLADGDRMGSLIDELPSMAAHKAFSRRLDERFAQRCQGIVEEHGGSLIYAGGDDVLALLPLHMALRAADALRRQFLVAMEELRGFFPTQEEKGRAENRGEHKEAQGHPLNNATLSVGLAVAHHLVPIAEVRELARAAEKEAKVARNSLAILVSKRSGGQRLVAGKWKVPEGRTPLHERIDRWCRYMIEGNLPMGTSYQIRDQLANLGVGAGTDRTSLRGVVSALVRLVLSRRDLSPQSKAALEALVAQALGEGDPLAGALRIADELEIAATFLEAYKAAWGEERLRGLLNAGAPSAETQEEVHP